MAVNRHLTTAAFSQYREQCRWQKNIDVILEYQYNKYIAMLEILLIFADSKQADAVANKYIER